MTLRNLFTLCLFVAIGAVIGSQVIGWWQESHGLYLHASNVPAGFPCAGSKQNCSGPNFKCEDGVLTVDDQITERCIVNNDPAPLTISVKP